MRARQACSSILALAAALLAGPLAAQGTLEVIGSRSLQVPPVRAAQPTMDFSIPVRWTGPANAKILLPVLEVNLGGEPREISAFGFLLQPDPVTLRPTLLARIDLAKAATTGTYTVKVQPPRPSAAAQPPAPLEFSFVRPAAEIRVHTPIRLERVVYLPWVLSTVRPRSLVLTESSSRSPILLADRTWEGDLSGADGKPSKGRLRFKLPAHIEAWQQGTAEVEFLDPPALGRSSGTLTLRSEQLAARSVDFPLEVASRASLLWLLLILVGSIALGYLTRTGIDERRKRLQASLAVQRQRGLLYQLLDVEADEDLQARLQEILNDLDTAEQTAGTDAEALTAAATQARTDVEAAMAHAKQRRDDLRARLAARKRALGPAEAQAASVEAAVQELLQKLAAQEKVLAEGHIGRVERFLEGEQGEINGLRNALEAWLGRLDHTLDRAGSWPDTPYATATAEARQEIGNLLAALASADSLEKLAPVLGSAAVLAGRVRNRLLAVGVPSILDLVGDMLKDLGELGEPALKPRLEALAGAKTRLEAARDRASADDLEEVAESLHGLREAVETILRAAYRLTWKQGDPTEPAGLAEGRYFGVLRDVLSRRRALEETEERPLGGPPPPGEEASYARAAALPAEAVDSGLRPVWTVVLEPPERPVAGRAAALSLRLEAPAGQSPPLVTVRWSVGGVVAHQGMPGDLGWSFTPRQPGPVLVRAEATAASGETQAAEVRLLVLPADGYDAIPALTAQLARDERTQSIVSGTLIALVGFAMFSGTFVGTFQDFLAAALWGYTIDFGVARVREMAAPLLARQPFSAPQ